MQGLLAAPVEAKGFRLNQILREDAKVFAEIVWEAPNGQTRLHTGICLFQHDSGHLLGRWVPQAVAGISSILSEELDRLMKTRNFDLFTADGRRFIEESFDQSPREANEAERTARNTSAYESSAKSGVVSAM